MEETSIDTHFEKKFSFEKQDDWIFPSTDSIYQKAAWKLKDMIDLKTQLNKAKSLLNDKGEHWHQHTANINKAGFVMDYVKSNICPEILTQAWCKFYEILCNYPIVSMKLEKFTSVHLCEAPGGFISALNYYLCLHHPNTSWNWVGNTLNPYYEGHDIKSVIVDDRLLFPTIRNWYFGKNDTGNLTDLDYIKDLLLFLENKGPISLITADGSVNCLEDPAEQELITSHLQFTEMLIAIKSLCPGGNFILKQFTTFESISICKMYILNCTFEKVHVFKPFCSKAGNSETYVVCLGFLGRQIFQSNIFHELEKYGLTNNKSLFPLSSIPETFLSQMESCSKYFLYLQIKAIEENLRMYSYELSSYEEILNAIKHQCAEHYLRKCSIFPNDNYDLVRLYPEKKQIKTSFYDKQNRNCKLMYFQAVGETFDNLCKSKTMIWQENIMDVDKRLNACFPVSLKRSQIEIKWHIVWKDIRNRMKSKSYTNWISIGKKVDNMRNSKFCNPMLIYLWNKISYSSEVKWVNHSVKDICYFEIDSILLLLEESSYDNFHFISVLDFEGCHVNDPLQSCLEKKFYNNSIYYLLDDTKETCFPLGKERNKIFYMNTSYWIESLHQESTIKNRLIIAFSQIIKHMNNGDYLIICIQSLLMRFTVGIIYIILSLFEKFYCLLPSSIAPASSGQLWLLKNFQKPEWTDRIVTYFEEISKFDYPNSEEVLQIVPITALCSSYYYEFLLQMNNDHMLQRLRSLTNFEKNNILC